MKYGTKLNIAFYSIIALMIFTAIITFINLEAIDEKQEYTFEHRVNRILLLDDMRYNLAYQRLFLRAYFLERTDKNRENPEIYAAKLDENIRVFKEGSCSQSLELVLEMENNH